jgi:hypothetical protein
MNIRLSERQVKILQKVEVRVEVGGVKSDWGVKLRLGGVKFRLAEE